MRRVVLTVLMILLVPFSAYAAKPVYVTGMQVFPAKYRTTLVFNLSAKTAGTVRFVPDVNRLQLHFENAKLRFRMHSAKLSNSNISEITAKEFSGNNVKFYFQTTGRVDWSTEYRVETDTRKVQLFMIVKSINKKTRKGGRVKASKEVIVKTLAGKYIDKSKKIKIESHQAIGRARWEKHKLKTSQRKTHLFTIVVDPGHGGKDTGAIGKTGLREKDVVLSISRRLVRKLKQIPGVRVVMTRQGDYYVPLRGRLNIARRDDADLFIAIHADAYFNNKVRGASVYALSQRAATSEAARWLAKQENYDELDGIALNSLPDRSRMVRSVLIDMAQTVTIRDSLRLGNKVLDSLDNVSSIRKKHVEQAPFVVLKSPDIPSILIETGFITNSREEKLLASPIYQERLANAVYKGVKWYVRHHRKK